MVILIIFEIRGMLRESMCGQDLKRMIARGLDDMCIKNRDHRNVSFSIQLWRANGKVKIRKRRVRFLLQVVRKNGTCEVANDLAKEAIEVCNEVQYISPL
jgi:hypothetical protein